MEAMLELSDDFYIPTNEFQTAITKELLESLPDEVAEQLLDFINSVEFIKRLISPDRKRARDLERDDKGRIKVDLANPHILEDMDYFRQMAIHYQKHGCYTFLRPNPNPNSEYRKLFDREIHRCRCGYVRESDGEWVTGYMYWYMNYCPIMLTKTEEGQKKASRIEDFPETWEGIYWRFHYLDQARNAGSHAIELARRGAHPYTENVFTPEGWKTWGEIKVGDKLFSTTGEVTEVIDIPYDREAPFYKITLRDGREVTASDDHLWVIQEGHKNYTQVLSTKELLSKYKKQRKVSDRIPSGIEYNCFILKNNGVELPTKETKVDPYTFGLLLGDGCFRHESCYFTQSRKDLEEEIINIPYPVNKWSAKDAYRIAIPNWTTILRHYNLYYTKSEDKFIPEEYKYNTKEVRLNILKGLFDTDGHVHGGVPTLSTVSERLKDDVLEIARSLGYNASFTKQKAGYKVDGKYKECLPVYIISVYAGPEIFNLTRKKDRVQYISGNAKSRRNRTAIINIEYLGITKCKCVTVSAQDSCYLIGDFITTHNCSKSYSLASIMAHNLILGENEEVKRRVTTILTAYQKEYLSDKDGTLSKFEPMIDFIAENTEFPRLRLRSSAQDMFWQMGYKDENGRNRGSLNSVMGVSSKDDEGKLRGKRGYILFEEMGSFPNLLSIYDTVKYGVEEGDYTYGLIYLVGTAAEDASDFESAKTLLYSPEGYNIYSIPNVFDKPRQGRATFGFFFPSYVNRKGCYNKDGVSDVVKALIQILMARYKAKYSSNPNSVIRVIAEMPITPAEAIIKVKAAYFPVVSLQERLRQLETDPKAFSDVYVGRLTQDSKGGEVRFEVTDDIPIRQYGGVDNSTPGALEIFEMPEKNSQGKVYSDRYIIGHDPVDNDQAESNSLSSTIVLDLFTDRIVAEYTGRQQFANDNYEIVRMLCLFYNAKCLYEANKKGIYAYFSTMNCSHLLADTPEYLREKQLVKYSSFGSNAHPYTEKVYTPDGLKLWEEIQVGDILFAPDGTTTKVVNIPIDEELDIYEITLRDGRKVRASGEHLWSVYKGAKTNKTPVLRTTVQLKEDLLYHREGRPSEPKYYIHKNCGVEYEEQFIPMNPYLLGLMLGDGCMSSKFKTSGKYLEFTSSIEDMKEYMEYLKLPYKTLDDRHHKIELAGWSDVVHYLKLANTNSHTKFIPDCYKYNSREVRLEVLKGLFDTDGTIAREGGTPYYTTTSKQLASDVLEIARSLGINGNMTESSNSYGSIYNVRLYTTTIVFKLKRKANKQRQVRCRDTFTSIIDIKYIGREKAKCVTVDREDGLYLIGDYITTHNCKGVNATAAVNAYANMLIKDWLLKPVTMPIIEDGEEKIITVPNLSFIRNKALIEELIAFNPEINVDRIRALGMVMLYREEKIILYQGLFDKEARDKAEAGYLGNDDYFSRNYDERFADKY